MDLSLFFMKELNSILRRRTPGPYTEDGMSNFDFICSEWPAIHSDCVRAESYVGSDPRTACVYSRRAVEGLVRYLYQLRRLPVPYKDDLAARINDPGFKTLTGNDINLKLNLLRKTGNDAVHDTRPVTPQIAAYALKGLFHVVVWAAFHHGRHPDQVPTAATFDPKLAQRAPALNPAQVSNIVAKFRAQDEARAKELAERDEVVAAQEAEIERLRQEVKAAQAAKRATDNHDYSEAETRDAFIDLLLHEAGWPLTDTRDREYPVTGMPTKEGTGRVDYVLWGADGLPLAVVEAKRSTHSAAVGQQQAKLYADCLETQFGRRPVVYFTNGYEHWLWDDASGYPPRQVQGFYTGDELELLIQRRHTRLPLSAAGINTDIAGRAYQTRAIRAVDDAFDRKQREALLVLATGSGKTRISIALVDQLMKANWVKRVLFLADRTALVEQAVKAFKAHLPSATTVNLVTEKSVDGRVYVSTYPTMLNLINNVEAESARRFGPGHFDLVIIDEAHRSVYAKYGAIFGYFDPLLLGLTATPKDEIDHNTYRLFHLEDGVPTDAYSLDEAVDDGYLVPARGIAVGTKFLRHGIRYTDLTEDEKDQWDTLEWGDDGPPDEVGSEELNRFLFNEDTVDKVLATLMGDGLKVAGGDRLGKSIIFAKSQAHAEFIEQRFNQQWPELGGSFARVITHGSPYAQSLIDDFTDANKAPHLAISVDMLDTGIDVPEVVNLVFFKLVRSKTKFWQMVGRGTRLCPDLFGPGRDKSEFLIFDFCGNLEFFGANPPTTEGSNQKSLTQCLVEYRLGLLTALDTTPAPDLGELRADTAHTLHEFVTGMNLDNVLVRPHRRAVERFSDATAWRPDALTAEAATEAQALAGLPSATRDSDEDAKRFDLLILRRQLAQLEGDAATAEKVRGAVQTVCTALLGKTAIPSVAQQAALLEEVAGDEWWVDLTLPMLEAARRRLRGLIRLVEKTRRNPVYTDFADTVLEATDIPLPGITPGTNRERFKAKATAYLRQHKDHVSLQRLRRNRQLTDADLSSLEQMLAQAGGDEPDMVWARSQSPDGLGVFIRTLIGLDRAAAQEAFAQFLDNTRYNVQQVRFVSLIIDELTRHGVMEPARLYESPYTDLAPTGPDLVFPDNDITVIVDVLRDVKKRAIPGEPAQTG